MGITTMGIPEAITLDLARLGNATVFIETGTFQGGTTRWASRHFPTVFTIERAEGLHREHSGALSRLPGVTPLLGDSRTVLPGIIAGLGERRAVHWLDGHWSGGPTAGADDECPLLDELACLAGRRHDLILIDDARLFLCAPPKPHRPAEWPTLPQIIDALTGPQGRPFIQVVDDVLFAIPDVEPLRSCLIEYSQVRSLDFWKAFAGSRAPKGLRGVLSRVKRRLRTT